MKVPDDTLIHGVRQPLWYVRQRGYWRLRLGYCPACDSSPPKPDCLVCAGDYKYGHENDDEKKRVWRGIWDSLIQRSIDYKDYHAPGK